MRRLDLKHRVWITVMAGALPALGLAGYGIMKSGVSARMGTVLMILAFGWLLGAAWFGRASVVFTLRTLSNVVGAIREGDYTLRLSPSTGGNASKDIIREINGLAGELHDQRLRDQEISALLRKVMGEIDVAVFAFDGRRRLALVNAAGERALDASAESLLGQGAEELGLGECLFGPASRTVELDLPGGRGRWELRRGGYRQHGRPHTLVLLSDVSRALREEELDAWRRLIRVIGHELNNSLTPMKSIAGSLRRMLNEQELPSDWKDDVSRGLEVIASRAEALKRFIDSYTSLAKLAPPSQGPVDAGRWVRRVAELETRVPVRVEEGPAVTLHADADQLDQLLINLVSNAAEASANVGSEIVVGWRREGRWLVVDVLDQGCGPPDPANLFVPFFTTKRAGSGLGLVMCRQIAENHGGIVELVGRKDGEGARATVRLPA